MADDTHRLVKDAWSVAARSCELKPGRMESREFLGQPVVIGRTRAGTVYALRDGCPHRAAKLSAGKVRIELDGGETIECPSHGWRFRTDGACASIPSLAADSSLDASKIRVRTYPIVEIQGLIWIWIATDPRFDGSPPEPPPVIPGAADAGAGRWISTWWKRR